LKQGNDSFQTQLSNTSNTVKLQLNCWKWPKTSNQLRILAALQAIAKTLLNHYVLLSYSQHRASCIWRRKKPLCVAKTWSCVFKCFARNVKIYFGSIALYLLLFYGQTQLAWFRLYSALHPLPGESRVDPGHSGDVGRKCFIQKKCVLEIQQTCPMTSL